MAKQQKKVLVVEDEEPMRVVLRDSLTDAGFSVTTAKNGEDGLMQAYQVHPDLILLDIVMPKMDGVTMMKKLRTDAWGKDVKILFLTNLSADNSMIKDAGTKDPFNYLVKTDYTMDEVVDHVKKMLTE